jgi:hypothetical protein
MADIANQSISLIEAQNFLSEMAPKEAFHFLRLQSVFHNTVHRLKSILPLHYIFSEVRQYGSLPSELQFAIIDGVPFFTYRSNMPRSAPHSLLPQANCRSKRPAKKLIVWKKRFRHQYFSTRRRSSVFW